MSILYPDVPNVPGVPPVLRDAANRVIDQVNALTADSADLAVSSDPLWGLYDSNDLLVVVPDSIVSVEYSKEEQISTFPVEQGGFQSYNKVETPYSVHLTMTMGGPSSDRENFLSECNQARASTDLYSVVTPEAIYTNANVTRLGYQRTSDKGAQLLTVEMVIEEVRNSAMSKFTASTAKDPASADAVNGGSVQTQTPTPAQTPPAGQPL